MNTFNKQTVLAAINQPAQDAWQLLDLDYNPAPMSISAYAAQAAKNIEDLEMFRFEVESGVYKDLGVTFEEFSAVVLSAAK